MNDTAAHLVDRVLPQTPIRQWVCSFPYGLHSLMGYDKALCADIINAFVTEVMKFYRYQTKHTLGLHSVSVAHPGAVTMLQRFDSALRLNVHAHTIAPDGVNANRIRLTPLQLWTLRPRGDGSAFRTGN